MLLATGHRVFTSHRTGRNRCGVLLQSFCCLPGVGLGRLGCIACLYRACASIAHTHAHSDPRTRVPRLRKAKKAIADAKQCVALRPDWGKAYSRLGAAYYAGGKYAEAIQAYAQGLGVEPSLATLTAGLAQAQVCSGALTTTAIGGACTPLWVWLWCGFGGVVVG